MPFSDSQKNRFVSTLEAWGWTHRAGVIIASSGGLWLDDSHFKTWSPAEMGQIFERRAKRIATAKIGSWKAAARENAEAAKAAYEIHRAGQG